MSPAIACRLVISATALLVCSSWLVPTARADEAAEAYRLKVLEAYEQTDTYHAKVIYQISRWGGRWRLVQLLEVALDRSAQKLLISRPDVLVVGDGKRLYARSDIVSGRYLDVPQPAPLTSVDLLEAAPFLRSPPLPGVLLLLGADPLSSGQELLLLDADPADTRGRRRLVFPVADGAITYLVDPERHLVTGVKWRQAHDPQGGLPGPADLSKEIEILRRNEPLEADLFNFDGGDDWAVGSVAELLGQAAPGAAAPSAPPPQAPPRDTSAQALVGRPAPPIKLTDLDGKPFSLDQVKADVIVLDFWATWCAPCVEWLPRIDELNQWARRGNKSVAVVAVNLREDRATVKRFWDSRSLTIPTLLDTSGSTSQAYRVEVIPTTVVISGGKVQYIHRGGGPQVAGKLKSQIEALLARTD